MCLASLWLTRSSVRSRPWPGLAARGARAQAVPALFRPPFLAASVLFRAALLLVRPHVMFLRIGLRALSYPLPVQRAAAALPVPERLFDMSG